MLKYLKNFFKKEPQPLSHGLLYISAKRGKEVFVYADKKLTTLLPNPVVADYDGNFPPIFVRSGSYSLVYSDKDGRPMQHIINCKVNKITDIGSNQMFYSD